MAGTGADDSCPLDPRVERSRQVILEATLSELAERGYGPLTIEGVAARAGVGKATVYRHWPGKLALVEDAVRTLKASHDPPAGSSPRTELLEMFRNLARWAAESRWSSCIPAIIEAAERDPAVRESHHRFTSERRQRAADLVRQAIQSGEVSDGVDPELAAEALAGPIFYRRLMTPEPFDPDAVEALLDLVLGPRPAP